MADWILLALIALAFYLLLQRVSVRLPLLPWRILWLVMILPPTSVLVAEQVFQYEMPLVLMVLIFSASYLASVYLLRRARGSQPEAKASQTTETTDQAAQSPKSDPVEPSVTLSTPLEGIAKALAHTPISEVPREQLNLCFPWHIFYLQTVEYRPQAIVCRGNLRVDPTEAYERIQGNVESTFGNRFLVVLQEGATNKPFFALVPNPAARRTTPDTPENPGLAIGLLLATLWSTLSAGAIAAGVKPDQLMDPRALAAGIPYALALIAILGTHELVRYIVARHHGIQTTLPYFIPVPFALGTFGAFIQLKEPVPNRKVLFDLGIAGSMAGAMVALAFLLAGLFLSTTSPIPVTTEGPIPFFIMQKADPTRSLLLGILARVTMGESLHADQLINLHPVAFAGWLGLLVTALNLMPIGQLDGGHVVHAVYGQQMGANVGRIARLIVLLMAVTIQPWLLLWAMLLFFISSADEPALNDVTDLSEGRDLLGLFMLTLLALIILPIPPFLQSWMGLA